MADSGNIYGYDPSVAGAVIFMLLFLGMLAWHGHIMFKKKVWYFIPFFIGVAFEFLGFAIRLASRKDPSNIPLYAMQMLFVLLAPALFAASIYMILGRMLVFYGAQFASIVSVRWMTRIFVIGDVLSFLLQCGGGGLQAQGGSMAKTGSNVVIGGLVIQLIFFGMFVVTSMIANRRLCKNNWPKDGPYRIQWQTMLNVLYCGSILILIRSIYRVAEYAEGYGGSIMTHEVYMYIFDILLMFVVTCIFIYWHPVYCMGNKVDKKAQSPMGRMPLHLRNVSQDTMEPPVMKAPQWTQTTNPGDYLNKV
uniref:ARAD1C19316p n=1 Tax=Blastobotrys adeninivorans TaxID=409370 RepID=A0A060T0X7_BLAAD